MVIHLASLACTCQNAPPPPNPQYRTSGSKIQEMQFPGLGLGYEVQFVFCQTWALLPMLSPFMELAGTMEEYSPRIEATA